MSDIERGSYSTCEIQRRTGITPRQLYYWESRGLLAPGYENFGKRRFRRYSERELERLLEIKAWLELGYSLEAVRRMQSQKVPATF